jgi:ornithine cyclodeaminase
MRTGAVATLAAQTFRHSKASVYSFIGLGNTARATLLCLLDSEPDIMHRVLLKKYKNQADLFIERFRDFANVTFEVLDDIGDMIRESDVVISCITAADGIICDDIDYFRPGVLVIPVHTRGFQNCDTVFDKVYADDTAHVCGFKYFNQFKQFAEIQDVISGKAKGRESDTERILSYNIGLGLHDVVYASKIYEILKDTSNDIKLIRETDKFWI